MNITYNLNCADKEELKISREKLNSIERPHHNNNSCLLTIAVFIVPLKGGSINYYTQQNYPSQFKEDGLTFNVKHKLQEYIAIKSTMEDT